MELLIKYIHLNLYKAKTTNFRFWKFNLVQHYYKNNISYCTSSDLELDVYSYFFFKNKAKTTGFTSYKWILIQIQGKISWITAIYKLLAWITAVLKLDPWTTAIFRLFAFLNYLLSLKHQCNNPSHERCSSRGTLEVLIAMAFHICH